MTLYDQFHAICQCHPQNVAYEGKGRVITYVRMLDDVEQVVAAMRAAGGRRGDRIAVSSGPLYPVFVLELACSKIGGTLVFLESFMAPNSGEWNEAVTGSSAHWTVTWENRESPRWMRTAVPHDSEPWFRPILLQARTSGTTGGSKGVCLSEAALLHAVRNTQQIAGVGAESRGMLVYEPLGLLSQIAGFSTLLAGATMVDGIAIADSPAQMAAFLERERISHLVMVPQHIAATLSDPQLSSRDLSNLKTVMYGAAPITRELMQRARAAISCRWLQCYGMTETTGPVCWLADDEQELAGFSVGRAAPGCMLRICDLESGEVLSAGAMGEVQVAGPLLMEGYWDTDGRIPVPGDALVGGWLRTGDLGALTEAGYLLLRGRASDEIVCALGYTIKPGEVEGALNGVSEIHASAVLGFEIGDAGVVPIVVCHVESDRESMSKVIRNAFHQNLDRSKHPTHFVLVDKPLPRGSNGKVQKSRLKTQISVGDLIPL